MRVPGGSLGSSGASAAAPAAASGCSAGGASTTTSSWLMLHHGFDGSRARRRCARGRAKRPYLRGSGAAARGGRVLRRVAAAPDRRLPIRLPSEVWDRGRGLWVRRCSASTRTTGAPSPLLGEAAWAAAAPDRRHWCVTAPSGGGAAPLPPDRTWGLGAGAWGQAGQLQYLLKMEGA